MAGSLKLKRGGASSTWLRALGGCLGLAGAIYVSLQLFEFGDQITSYGFPPGFLAFVAGLACAYGASNLLLALAWKHLFSEFQAEVETRTVIRIYAATLLAKYLPGNVFQIVGRHALARSIGLGHGVTAKAAFFEIAFLALGGALLAILAIGFFLPHYSPWIWFSACIAVSVAACVVVRRLMGSEAAVSLVLYQAFLAISGLLFVVVIANSGLESLSVRETPYLAGAFVLSWLVGLITPGAPAGIGVREAVLTVLLATIAPASTVLIAVIVSRVVTILGDILFFLFARIADGLGFLSPERIGS